MSPDDKFIWVVNWEKFQTYQMKRGKLWAPPWIKVYVNLLADDEYLKLTGTRRGLLHDLWLLFAEFEMKLPYSPAMIVRRLYPGNYGGDDDGAKVAQEWREGGVTLAQSWRVKQRVDGAGLARPRDFRALEQAKFINICSRTVMEQNRAAFLNCSALEVEVEVDNPKPLNLKKKRAPRRKAGKQLERALAFIRNAGHQYEPSAYEEEIARFDLDTYERHQADELYTSLAATPVAAAVAVTSNGIPDLFLDTEPDPQEDT